MNNGELSFFYQNRAHTSIKLDKPLLDTELARLVRQWERGKRYTMVFEDGVNMSFDLKQVQQIQYLPPAADANVTNTEEAVA